MPAQKRNKTTRPQIVGVIASPTDLQFALAMRAPPDLFELRLDCFLSSLDKLVAKVESLPSPIIVTTRDPREGGIGNLSPEQRANLLARFLVYAKYLDIELRNARAFKPLLAYARKRNVRVIVSFHDFKSTPSSRSLRTKALAAKKRGADIFKIATRTDTPAELAQLVDFITHKSVDLPVSAMGIGKLGALSRLLLARCGSVLNYASFGRPTVEGQLPIELLRSALPQ